MEYYQESEQTNEINIAMSSFKAKMPAITKDVNVNMKGTSKSGKEFTIDYDYSPLETIQDKADPILVENKLSVNQFLTMAVVSGVVVEGIVTRIGHSSGQWLRAFWPIQMDGITKEQDRGSKITYNKRYAYVAALDIKLQSEDNDAAGVEKTIDPLEYKIEMGPKNKLTGTKIKDHDIAFLQKYAKDTLAYYEKENKKPHANAIKFAEMVEAASKVERIPF